MYNDQYLRVTVNTANTAMDRKVMVFTVDRDSGDLEPWNKASHGPLTYCQGLFILTEELPKLDNKR